MSQHATCPYCGSTNVGPATGNAEQLRCGACGAWFSGSTPQVDPTQQWFVTFPDGRQFGPLTADQMYAAQQRGRVPADAFVRRGDWANAISHSAFLAQQAELQRASSYESDDGSHVRAGAGYGTAAQGSTQPSYLDQLSQNPVGTVVFGPQLDAYQANQSANVKATRKKQFMWWLILLATLFFVAVTFPLIAGLLRGNVQMGVGAAAIAVFWSFWPMLFFLIGMLLFAGAWFEWRWFFHSRRARAMRAMFGDSGARKFYLGFGSILMIGGALFSLGGSVVIAGSVMFERTPRQRVAQDRERVKDQEESNARLLAQMERELTSARRHLEQVGRPLHAAASQGKTLELQISDRPNDLALREKLLVSQGQVQRLYPAYRSARRNWESRVTTLRQWSEKLHMVSAELDKNDRLPAELDYSQEIITPPTEKFPLQNVRSSVSQLEERRRAMDQLLTTANSSNLAAIGQTARQIDQMRDYLTSVEKKWGYRHAELDKPTGAELVERARSIVAGKSDPAPSTPASSSQSKPGTSTTASSAGVPTPRPGRPFPAPASRPDPPSRPVVPRPNNFPGRPDVPGRPPFASMLPPQKLLVGFNPAIQTVRGRVTLDASNGQPSLITEAMEEHALAYVRSRPLRNNYVIEANVTRLEGRGGLCLVLPLAGPQAALVIDGGSEDDPRTGLVAIDNQVLRSPDYPGKATVGVQLPKDKRIHLRCIVTPEEISLQLDGSQVYQWKGDYGRFSLPPFYRSAFRIYLHVGGFHSRHRIENLVVRFPRP